MITKIELENFKNFKGRVSIDLCDPAVDTSYFNVIVGRNGTGKSCIIEAIDWCLFRGTARDMRGGSVRDLVHNEASEGRMSVTCTLTSRLQK
jgi:chromosome segregation ATPase